MENRTGHHVLGTSKSKLSMVDKTEGKDFASVTGSQDFKYHSSGSPNGTCRKSDEQRTLKKKQSCCYQNVDSVERLLVAYSTCVVITYDNHISLAPAREPVRKCANVSFPLRQCLEIF